LWTHSKSLCLRCTVAENQRDTRRCWYSLHGTMILLWYYMSVNYF
jgi:hypothetical protein